MNWREYINQHRFGVSYAVMAAYLLINNTINASSVWMEHSRHGEPGIAFWEPFCWEYTSAASSLLLLPVLFLAYERWPLRLSGIRRQLLIHLTGTVLFSLAHVGIMVGLRYLIYHFQPQTYGFGNWPVELWYEYRKDAWGYVLLLIVWQMAAFILPRLQGEAHRIAESESQTETESTQTSVPEHFLVKKLDKEFLVRVAEIDWLESSGNYVNLHSRGRIYPLRATLGQTVEQLKPAGFIRVHRSHAINRRGIESIRYFPSGDGEIQLHSGATLTLSRRYKDELKQALG